MRAKDVNFLAGESASDALRIPTAEEKRAIQLDELAGRIARRRGWTRRRARRFIERAVAKNQPLPEE